MTTHNSTPPDARNFDPVADAMARANLSAATARAKLDENSRRVALLKSWREHPDVLAFVAEQRRANDFQSWPDLSAAVGEHRYCRWSVRHEIICLMLACAQQVGMAELSDADREIIGEKYPDEDRDGVEPDARKWLLVRDTKSVCPPADAAAWAPAYRAGLHEQLRDRGMAIGVAPGQAPVLAVWNGEAQPPSVYRNWLAQIGSDRFELVQDAGASDWLSFAPAKVQGATRKAAFTVHSTGIGPLDALLATKGIPRGARVFVQAATGHGKSVFDLQVAEHFAAAGFRVAWVATSDESPESLIARRLQRVGHARDEALRLALGDEAASVAARAKLNPNLEIVDGTREYLEDVIARAPDVLVLDPVQKVRTRGGDDGEAAVRIAEQSGITLVAAASKVRSSGKRAKIEAAFGGAFIENGATLLLDLERDGSTVTVSVLKSRYGGEGQSFALELDPEWQTLTPCHEPDELDAVVDEVLSVLADNDGTPLALRAVQVIARMPRARRKADVLAALKRAVETGKVTKADGKNGAYALRESST